jgi:uncharacterized DUF497 family protein
MPFLWDANNTAHLGKHGVSPELAERVFWAGCGAISPARIKHRWVIEAEVDGCLYRLIFDRSREGAIYPITCFPL